LAADGKGLEAEASGKKTFSSPIATLDSDSEFHQKYKKEKSLGLLCSQFIALFVSWKPVISLEEAAK